VKVNLSATDAGTNAAGVEKTEYRITTDGNAGEWKTFNNTAGDNPFLNTITVATSGTHVVEFRSTDKAANQEATKSVTFKIQMPVCDRSDEFDGDEILPRWLRHTRNGGTPTTGPLAPTVSGGQLHLPTNDFEIDAASGTTSVGPINLLGQDLNALGENWSVETQFTILHRGGWQNVGLVVWNGDNNFFRSTITHSLSGGNIYVESSKDNPTSAEGARQTAGGNVTVSPTKQEITIKMRYRRVNGANNVQAHYQIVAPASIANDDWVAFPNTGTFLDLNPAGGPRRDAPGSQIGLIAQDNWPGQGGAFPADGPAIAHVDYFRVTPDNCPPEADVTPPTTSHTLSPATPNGQGGYYTSPVNVTLTATDEQGGSGIDKTEYRIGSGAFQTYSAPIAVATDGNHSIEYRSVDKNGNVEATKSVAVKLDATAPSSTASLNPAEPGPGGTYDGPVELTLAGTDATSGMAKLEYQVNAVGAFGAFGARSLAANEALEWVTYDPANKPVFSAPGPYTIEYRATDVAGNVETAKTVSFSIRSDQNDTDAPVTTATLDPAQPGPGKTYSTAVTVNLSALDPAEEGPEPKTVDVSASGNSWDPSALNINNGDTVRWNFPSDEGQPHDVWTVPPGGNPAPGSPDLTQVTNGPKFPGEPPVTKTLTQNGTWTFICRLHSSFSEGSWSGMVGTAVVVAAQATNPPSGVDYTEYRVKTGDTQGDWVRKTNDGGANPFVSSFQVTAEGSHTVEYRSVDEAGNVEATKSVAFNIDLPDPGFPVIQAFADPASGKAPLQVRFTATGFDPDGGPLTYKWEFADGTAFGWAVTRTFTTPGTYTATVTATDDEGTTSSKEVQVVVTAPDVVPPTVEASADVSRGPAPLRVQFSAAGNDPDGPEDDLVYTWDFGDGGTSLAQNPAHTYTSPGTYTAKVTVTEPSGAIASDTVEIEVTNPTGNRPPTVEVGALPKSGNAPLEVLFTAQGSDPDGDSLTYTWDFDDGSPAGSGRSVTHVFTDGGTYNVEVTASDGRGGTATAEIPIVVGDPPGNQAPTVVAAADPKTGTAPLTVEFSSHAIDPDGDDLLVTWAFGDGGQAAGREATHTYTAAGTYTATVTAMDPSGATGSATVQVVVSAPPTQQQQQAPVLNTNAAAGGDAQPAPAQEAWFGVSKPASTTVSSFAKRGLAVRVTCTEAMSGTAKVTVSNSTRKALGLKSRTLATGKVKCDGAGSERVRLKVSKTVRRALADVNRTVRAKLTVRLRSAGEPATQSTRSITLKRH
ncbi:MAG TPA: PKD domain-containing protein, partial [Solirubrobacter sp.]|nr:PKD domain-containing protein [Solirubrobacter sp.]